MAGIARMVRGIPDNDHPFLDLNFPEAKLSSSI